MVAIITHYRTLIVSCIITDVHTQPLEFRITDTYKYITNELNIFNEYTKDSGNKRIKSMHRKEERDYCLISSLTSYAWKRRMRILSYIFINKIMLYPCL